MTYDRTLLKPDELNLFIELNPSWKLNSGELVKTYEFPRFPEAIRFVARLAESAEAKNHHPDIDIRYRRVTLHLSTHDAGGLTFRDLELAQEADRLFGTN
jgi:4a-hydroxytetrahydrobiopterin dehydratase